MLGSVFTLDNMILYTVTFPHFSKYLYSRSEYWFGSEFGFSSEEYPLTMTILSERRACRDKKWPDQ